MAEASLQHVSLESFSYRWLVNPMLRDESDEGSFIEMDPRLPPSKRFNLSYMNLNPQDFKFDFPVSPSELPLVPADELFAEGFVLPLFMGPSNVNISKSSNSIPVSWQNLDLYDPPKPQETTSRSVPLTTRRRQHRRMSKRFFCKFLYIFRTLCRNFQGQAAKNWIYPEDETPKTSFAYSDDRCRSSCDSESSIHEAVLHCKRSNGN